MSERVNKTSIYSIVFLDIIDYSKKAVSLQIEQKEAFNKISAQALEGIAASDRIILDTGDGLAIALLGEPQEALFVSLTIRDDIVQYNIDHQSDLFVRIGINLGPVRVVKDINGRPNIIGDGINVAERVMSFAKPNQILVSRTYYEVTSRLTDEINVMFSYFGMKQDKHVREHEIYEINAEAKTAKSSADINGIKPNNSVSGSWGLGSNWLNKTQLLDQHFLLTYKYHLLIAALLLLTALLFAMPQTPPQITLTPEEAAGGLTGESATGSANTMTLLPTKPGNIDATLDLSHLRNDDTVAQNNENGALTLLNGDSASKDSAGKTSASNKSKSSKKLATSLPEKSTLPTMLSPAESESAKQAALDAKNTTEPPAPQVIAPVIIDAPIRSCTQAERAMNQCH